VSEPWTLSTFSQGNHFSGKRGNFGKFNGCQMENSVNCDGKMLSGKTMVSFVPRAAVVCYWHNVFDGSFLALCSACYTAIGVCFVIILLLMYNVGNFNIVNGSIEYQGNCMNGVWPITDRRQLFLGGNLWILAIRPWVGKLSTLE